MSTKSSELFAFLVWFYTFVLATLNIKHLDNDASVGEFAQKEKLHYSFYTIQRLNR